MDKKILCTTAFRQLGYICFFFIVLNDLVFEPFTQRFSQEILVQRVRFNNKTKFKQGASTASCFLTIPSFIHFFACWMGLACSSCVNVFSSQWKAKNVGEMVWSKLPMFYEKKKVLWKKKNIHGRFIRKTSEHLSDWCCGSIAIGLHWSLNT